MTHNVTQSRLGRRCAYLDQTDAGDLFVLWSKAQLRKKVYIRAGAVGNSPAELAPQPRLRQSQIVPHYVNGLL
jgi:hypothetical protein